MLQSRLRAIDEKIEAAAQEEVTVLLQQIRYDGSRLRIPPYSDVSAIWMRMIESKEMALAAEIERHLSSVPFIDETLVDSLISTLTTILDDDRYLERLARFHESVGRRAASYGLPPGSDHSNFAHFDVLYRVSIHNKARSARTCLRDTIMLQLARKGRKMDFEDLMTDTISVLKKDGRRFEGIKASVRSTEISIVGADHLIESGDIVSRKMSNGGEETFEVIDPGFREEFFSIPAGYRMAVRKLGIPEARAAVQNIYNIAGNNTRINQNSVDNSTNTVNVNPDAMIHIKALRDAMTQALLTPEGKQSAGEMIDAVENQFRSGKPSKPVVSALLSALPFVESVTSIAASIKDLC
jgi:hypothetical protein